MSPDRIQGRLLAEADQALGHTLADGMRCMIYLMVEHPEGRGLDTPDIGDVRSAGICGHRGFVGTCQQSVVHPPNRGLCPVLNPDLAKDRLDVDLHGCLGDFELPRDAFVGIAFDKAAQDSPFPRRKLR